MARVRGDSDSAMDTVAQSKTHTAERRAWDVLQEAERYWQNMDKFRRDRTRAKRYCYGDQWQDVIHVDGTTMSEEQYIKSQGNVPLKNNLIRRLVRNVLGTYRSQSTEPTCTARDRDEQKIGETMSTVLQYNMQLNRSKELNARSMEEFLISGLVVHRKWFGWRNGKMECWTDYVQPNNFFMDSNMRDFRGWDVSCIGEIHDISFETLVGQFAKSPADYTRLANIYREARDRGRFADAWREFGYDDLKTYDFYVPWDGTRCRVIEVWRKESKPRYRCHDYNNGDVYKIDVEDYGVMIEAVNRDRIERGTALGMDPNDIPLIQTEWFLDDYWYYYYLTPFGDILAEGETPYEHGSHPYVFKPYPFIDGEIHSFVSDVIDQQRYTNRLITLYDWIMRASAKGVLLFPEECLPKGYNIDDIADEWSRFNGVIMMKTKGNATIPQQVANNSTNIGITELLNIQLKLFEDISGVNGALQGKPGYSGMSAALYNQQTQNATTSLLDLLDSYGQFIIDAAYKDVKNIQQFYDIKRTINITGKAGASVEYDPQKIRDVEFDLSIIESTSTPAYRAMANDFLMEIWKTGQISLQQMLQTGSFPFADELLQSLQSQQEQLENGEVPEGLSPQLQQQVQQGANMQAVQQGYNALTGQGQQQQQ
jgi:hypothetical protein